MKVLLSVTEDGQYGLSVDGVEGGEKATLGDPLETVISGRRFLAMLDGEDGEPASIADSYVYADVTPVDNADVEIDWPEEYEDEEDENEDGDDDEDSDDSDDE